MTSIYATNSTLYATTQSSTVYYSINNGSNWSHTNQPDGSAVNSVFATFTTLYTGTANGNVVYSTNGGATWTATIAQPDGSAVNSIYVTNTALYAGTANGNVAYSANGGMSWTIINGQPDGSAVRSVFATNNTLYVGTANEYVYSSTSLSGGGVWSTYAQTVYSLFVNADGSIIDAGTQGGYLFSLTNGSELGFITYSPINSVFLLLM